jgi:hypothetical protein
MVVGIGKRVRTMVHAFAGQPILALTVVGMQYAFRRYRREAVALLLFTGALLMSNWMFGHYAAPALVLMVLLAVAALRAMAWRWAWALPVVMVVYVGTAGYWVVDRALTYPESWGRVRQSVVADLLENPGDDLVLVRAAPKGDVHREWVYNLADVDRAPIVWARDMGEAGNAELVKYYRGRVVWVLDVGTGEIRRI